MHTKEIRMSLLRELSRLSRRHFGLSSYGSSLDWDRSWADTGWKVRKMGH